MSSLIEFRRDLHAHPALAHGEHDTARRVVEFLTPLGPDRLLTGLGGTGVLATFDSGLPGPAQLYRCELDALPIVEHGDAGHRSRHDGVAHKCGHDGHMAILAGLAQRLAAQRPAGGVVHLLFQPAEETGTGAAAVLADPAFAAIRPDFGVALHNMPGFPLHHVVVKPGAMTCAVRSIVVRFTGRTAHASEPELGENPSLAVADLVRSCDRLNVTDAHAPDFGLVTPIHVRIGSPAYGVSAGDGEVHLTMRASTDDRLSALERSIGDEARALGVRDRLRVDLDVVEDFAATVNDPGVTDRVLAAADDCGLTVVTPDVGMRAGEDFGLFGSRFPCCLVLLGAGEDHDPIHSPSYDFPDELIPTGVELLDRIVRRAGLA